MPLPQDMSKPHSVSTLYQTQIAHDTFFDVRDHIFVTLETISPRGLKLRRYLDSLGSFSTDSAF